MDNKKISKELNNIFSSFQSKPILFFGSGMSKRYLSLPDWISLLKEFASKTQPSNPFAFKSYKKRAEDFIKENNLSEELINPTIAEFIESDYDNEFYSNPDFETEIKLKYPKISSNDISPFKLSLCDFLESSQSETETLKNEIVQLAAIKNKFSNVITTNYDNFLETIFSNYSVLIGQNYIFNNKVRSIGNIFKIHGSIDEPNSIIISLKDYNDFNKKSKFLSAKLLTLFMEYPIIFMGYGINDINIRNIFQDIRLCLNDKTIEMISKKMLFIEHAEKESEQNIIVTEIAGLQMIKIKLFDYNLLYNSFNYILDTVDVNTLRILEDKIAQLIESTDKNIDRVYATSLENKELNENNLAVYIAHKSSVFDLGYSSLKLINICEDVLFNNKNYDSKAILENTILKQKGFFNRSKIPVYKYLSNYEGELDDFYIRNNCIIHQLEDIYNSQDKRTRLYKHPISKLSHIIGTEDTLSTKIYNIYLSLRNLNIDDVKEYIKTIWSKKEELSSTTHLTKIICVIDLYENKKEHE